MHRLVTLAFAAIFATGCGASSTSATAPTTFSTSGPFAFTVAPMDMTGVTITPLGNLVPPDHVLPTDHIYFVGPALAGARTLVSPMDGQVQFVQAGATGSTLGIRNGSFLLQWGPIKLDAGITTGTVLKAGQRVGLTVGDYPGVDFGLMNYSRQVAFVNPARYVDTQLYCDSPIAWFQEPLRSQLYAAVQRVGGDKDSKINFDVSGRLAGNWFAEGLSPSVSQNPSSWAQHLAFVYDNFDPSLRRISTGTAIGALNGLFQPADGAPDFGDVSPATGKVIYSLILPNAPGSARPLRDPVGRMIVQMLDSSRIRVETISGTDQANPDFSAAARIYVR